MNMKKVIILSSILLGAAFLGAGCTQQLTDKLQSVLPTSVTNQLSQPATNQTPDDGSATVIDDNGTLKTYQNKEYGFEFKYPKEWKTQSTNLMASLGEKSRIEFASGLSVSVWDTSTYSLDDLKAAPPGGIDPDSVKEATIKINGYSADEVSYVMVSDSASGSKSNKKIVILKDGLVYLIEGNAEECAAVISTFKFTE